MGCTGAPSNDPTIMLKVNYGKILHNVLFFLNHNVAHFTSLIYGNLAHIAMIKFVSLGKSYSYFITITI